MLWSWVLWGLLLRELGCSWWCWPPAADPSFPCIEPTPQDHLQIEPRIYNSASSMQVRRKLNTSLHYMQEKGIWLDLRWRAQWKMLKAPILWQSLVLYKLLIHWMRLAILVAIKAAFEPHQERYQDWTLSREYQVRFSAQPRNQSPMCHAHKKVILSAPRYVIPRATHRGCTRALGQENPEDQAQWAQLHCTDKGWEAITPEDPSVRPESLTHFWASREKRLESGFERNSILIIPWVVAVLNDYIRKAETS